MILDKYEPQSVFRFFEEVCSIPHGSGNTKKISDYLFNFACKRGLDVAQDKLNNIIIRKPASPGYETRPSVIIQGHMDMVCEKENGYEIDFLNEGLRLCGDGEYIFAEGTTLGGDDGIAVAYALALLETAEPMPALEVLITVDEEIGMLGAAYVDISSLKGKYLLNIDSEDEGVLTVSCAGGTTAVLEIPISKADFQGTIYTITVSGLLGGHSGTEINQPRANANKIMGEILASVKTPFAVKSLSGGNKDNAIPRSCTAVICSVCAIEFSDIIDEIVKMWKYCENGISITAEAVSGACMAVDYASSEKITALLNQLPNGVQKMSRDIENLVQTSLNLGIMHIKNDKFTLSFSVRSSVDDEKEELCAELKEAAVQCGGTYSESGAYPAWEYKKDSHLRDVMIDSYEKLFGVKPKVEAIHAGLECGLLASKKSGLDCVSFGPDILNIHTAEEKLSIVSVQRTWRWLRDTIENLK